MESESAIRPKRVLINVASNWLALLVNIVASLVVVPFLVSQLGVVRYGVWATLAGLLGFLMILDLGTASAINRYVARYRALGSMDQVRASVAGAMYLFIGIGSTLVIASWWLAPAFVALFPLIPIDLVEDAILTTRLVCMAVGVRLLHGPFNGLMAGWHRYDLVSTVQIVIVVARLILIFSLMLSWRVAIYVPVLAVVIANIFGLVLQLVLARRLLGGLRFLGPSRVDRAVLKDILVLGGHMLIITLCTLIVYQGPVFVLARLVGPEAVTPFSVGMLIITTCLQGVHGVSRVFTPVFSSVDATHDTAIVARLVLRACRILGVISAGMCAMLLVVGRPFLELWMGGRTPSAFDVVAILTIAHAILWPNTIVQSAFSGTGRLWPIAVGWIAATIGVIVLGTWLVLTTSIAGRAMAIGIAVPLLVQQVFFVPYMFQRCFGPSAIHFVARVHLGPLALATVVGAPVYGVTKWLDVSTWPALIACGGLLCAIYGAGAFRFLLNADERHVLLSALRGRAAPNACSEESASSERSG